MALPVTDLDDRRFQDIINEARRKIPLYTPEWTDHNLSDPGITLVELFAWMTEMIIYRLNKVPDKNYIKFLELIGVELAPAAPASAELTFSLSAELPNVITIPAGTEVATVRTETEDATVFTTVEDVTVEPAELTHFVTSVDNTRFDDLLPRLQAWQDLAGTPGEEGRVLSLFQQIPEPGNAFYFGFNNDLRRTTLTLRLNCVERAAPGIVPSNAPIQWQYWDAEQQDWLPFQRNQDAEAWIEVDETRGLNTIGDVILHIPRTAGQSEVGLREGFWVRCIALQGTPETGYYTSSPQISSIGGYTIGGLALASNTATVRNEVVGQSNGKPGQIFQLSEQPALPLEEGETVQIELEDGSGWDIWEQVADFSESGPDDKHFIFDPVLGEIRFGPVVRSQSGMERQYGVIPLTGMHVGMTAYRFGGGPDGNVGQNTLTELQSGIPYVSSVTNRRVASGGVDPENVESAKIRGPQTLRTRNRAVTEEDFEHLAREASPSVVRTKCIQPREVGTEGDPLPGVVRVLLVPTLPASAERTVMPEDLRIQRELLDQVKDYLDERRLLTTMLIVSEPEYHWASVEAKVKILPGADPDQVREAVEDRLYKFIHPVHGGREGDGWTFGRSLFASELYSQVQPVPGVEYIEGITVHPVDTETWEKGEATENLIVPRSGLLCSYRHSVICT